MKVQLLWLTIFLTLDYSCQRAIDICNTSCGVRLQTLTIINERRHSKQTQCSCIVTGPKLNVTGESGKGENWDCHSIGRGSVVLPDGLAISCSINMESALLTWYRKKSQSWINWNVTVESTGNLQFLCSGAINEVMIAHEETLKGPMKNPLETSQKDGGDKGVLVAVLPVVGAVAGILLTLGAVIAVRFVRRRGQAESYQLRNVERIHSVFDDLSTSRDQLSHDSHQNNSHSRNADSTWYMINADGDYVPSSKRPHRGAKNPSMPMEFRNLSLFKSSPDETRPEQEGTSASLQF